MSKYRIKFSKGDEVKYIGHLDVMRLFQRAVRRAEIPIAYSKGFNPHQLMAFANPLSLGMTSAGEYGDFELKEDISTSELTMRLNTVLPEGVKVIESVVLKEGSENAMAAVRAAKYEVILNDEIDSKKLDKAVETVLLKDELLIMKKTKSNEKMSDIRADIIDIKVLEPLKLSLCLRAGSERNLRADLTIKAILEQAGEEYMQYKIKYHRVDLMKLENEEIVSLNIGV